MVQLGYALSSEEHTPNDLVRYAQGAEEVGFAFALISDHYHPWLDQQGESPFVWSVKGELSQELPTPAYFAQATQLVCEDDIAEVIVCGPDPAKHIEKIQAFVKAGYDHVYIHQVGPDREGLFQFYQREILPKFR